MITGLQVLQTRRSVRYERKDLARRAKVPLSVIKRAEGSPGEPAVTIAQLSALMRALRTADATS